MRSILAARRSRPVLVVGCVAVMFLAVLTFRAPVVDAAPVPVPWLKTVGNKIVTANTDQEVTLRGKHSRPPGGSDPLWMPWCEPGLWVLRLGWVMVARGCR